MLGARRAALAAAARLARQARCNSAVSRSVYPTQEAPAVFSAKQNELQFARSFAAAAEPAPVPSAGKGTVKTVCCIAWLRMDPIFFQHDSEKIYALIAYAAPVQLYQFPI